MAKMNNIHTRQIILFHLNQLITLLEKWTLLKLMPKNKNIDH